MTSSTGSFVLTCAHPTLLLTATSGHTAGPVTYMWTNPQVGSVAGSSIAISVAGNYTVTATSGSVTESKTLNIGTDTLAPSVHITTSSDSLSCKTVSVQLTAHSTPSTVSYLWTELPVGSGFTTSGCVVYYPGVYGVTVTNTGNGCKSTATADIADGFIFPVLATPDLFTVACPDGTVALSVPVINNKENLSYDWQTPAGANTIEKNVPVLTTNAPGSYTLSVANTVSGCLAQTEVLVYACVGLAGDDQNPVIRLFPNPVSNKFNVEFPFSAAWLLRLTDSYGKIISIGRVDGASTSFETDNLQSGVYFFIATSHRGRSTQKFIKE